MVVKTLDEKMIPVSKGKFKFDYIVSRDEEQELGNQLIWVESTPLSYCVTLAK
jgi:hypothetical protein